MNEVLLSLLSILRNSRFWALFLLLVFTSVDSCQACECVPIPVCEKIPRASAVFLGSILDDGSSSQPDQQGRIKFQFAVNEVFKGLSPDTKRVDVWATTGEDCGTALIKGRYYLIFAMRSRTQWVVNNDCNGVINHREAKEDLQYLRTWTKGLTSTVLHGVVRVDLADTSVKDVDIQGLAEAEVVARGREKTYRVKTDAVGNFEFKDLQPERYEISARLPGDEKPVSNYRISVKKGLCTRLDIKVPIPGSVSGTVYNEKGEPTKGIRVELAPMTQGDLHSSEEVLTDGEGHYEFTKVLPGNYYLGVNLERGLNSQLPFSTCYYPGVSSRDQALVVAIEGVQKLTQYDFQLGSRHPTRPIRVVVKWWDGRPVNNASVECRIDSGSDSTPKDDAMIRYTDERGEVLFNALEEKGYRVAADQLFWIRSSRQVQDHQVFHVPADNGPVSVQLVISQDNDIRIEEDPVNMSRFNN